MNQKLKPEYYKEQIFSLTNLPTIPVIATEILRVCREDRLSVSQLLPIIEKDPPLALKILKIANSAYYGFRHKMESLRQAIVVIGMRELSHLVLSFTVIKLLIDRNDQYNWLEWKRLWEHSAACGHIAQLFCKKLKLSIPSSPYSLGLLHDIGKLVLYRLAPEQYIEAVKLAQNENLTSYQAEMEMLGVTHSDVGKWLAKKWELPDAIINTIGYHHHPKDVPDPDYKISTSLIQVSDIVCNLKSINFETNFIQTIPREEEGWLILQDKNESLKDLDFERFVMEIDDEIDTIKAMVELTQM